MKKLVLASMASGIFVAPQAEQVAALNSELKITGAIPAGYFFSTNTGSSNQSAFKLSNLFISISSEMKDGDFSINSGFGTVLFPTVYDGGLTENKAILSPKFGVIYGYLSYKPESHITIDAGLLTTNIGYEATTSFTNPNIMYGALWSAQPVIYPGARLTYQIGEIKLYGEISKDQGLYDGNATLPTSGSYAVGALGSAGGFDFALSYYDYAAYKNLFDVVISKEVNQYLKLGLDLDYQWLDDSAKQPGYNSDGYGIGMYVIPHFENIYIPTRVEYFSDGSKGKESGIYSNVSKAYTLTITPTYKPTKNSYIRFETSYFKADNEIFKDETGNPKSAKTSAAVELGFLF